MKKLLTLLTIALSLVLINHSCKPKEEEPGSIYGVVTDKATGEPVKNANVQLRPTGETTLTGNDGRYEFLDVKNGEYSISVSKTGYTNLVDDYVIIVDGPKEMRRDVQIEKLPAELRVMDGEGNDITELDFGSMHDDNTRMFNIFNNGTIALEYEIIKTASWIKSINPQQGSLQPGETKPVVIIIDRDKMSMGNNTTSISITTNDGGKLLTIKANKAGAISTLEAMDVTKTSALLCGSINENLTYTEKGFYYGDDHSVEEKQVVSGYSIGEFSHKLTDLEMKKTYYYKAYMVKVGGETVFGVLMSFTTLGDNGGGDDDNGNDDNEEDDNGNNDDMINGHEYVDLGLPSGLKWATCNVGANSPEMPGGYYAWGELETKDYYSSNNSLTYEVEMDDISGDPAYDVAAAEWGSTWRMPKLSEINEMKSNCYYPEEIEINGRKCYKYTSAINGASIILPHTGEKSGYDTYYYNGYGSYWSSTPYQSNLNNRSYAKYNYGNGVETPERFMGLSIRPVSE